MLDQVPGGRAERLSDQAYQVLRDKIVHLELRPLSPITEKVISADLGIGVQPVREAIRRLEQDRLVTIFPRRGTFVAEVGIHDEQRVTEIRVELEGLCAELAAVRATAEECDRLIELAEEHRDRPEDREMDEQFHRTLYPMAKNSYLEKNLDQYYNLTLRNWVFFVSNRSLPNQRAHADHLETALAIRDRDSQRAGELARNHVRRSSRRLMDLLAAERF